MNELVLNPTSVNFLEANTNAITFEELAEQCVVPTWANQELTISHQDFISTVHDAACNIFAGETINNPEIRVSHIVRGRIPSALNKRSSELLECINGQRLELCVGGVRNYSDLNLYRANRGMEKFTVFIGWRVNVCSNQVLTGDGVKLSFEVMSLHDLYKAVLDLFYNFNLDNDIQLLQSLTQMRLSETQFAQIVGRMRLYQALPSHLQRELPKLLITDSQINNVCRDYYSKPKIGTKD